MGAVEALVLELIYGKGSCLPCDKLCFNALTVVFECIGGKWDLRVTPFKTWHEHWLDMVVL